MSSLTLFVHIIYTHHIHIQIQMHNGCICCTLRGDLLKTVKQLALDDANYDYLVIESTGISEPLPVAQTFVLNANEEEDEDGDEGGEDKGTNNEEEQFEPWIR